MALTLKWLGDFDWLTILCFSLLIGLFQWTEIHFSPLNYPFELAQGATMLDKGIITLIHVACEPSDIVGIETCSQDGNRAGLELLNCQ